MLNNIKSFRKMISLPQAECEIYCRNKLLERYEKHGGKVNCLTLHSMANRILVPIMRMEMALTNRIIIIQRDRHKKTKRPIIFCPTHIGGVDIEMTFLAIGRPNWMLMGDPRELYKSFNGMMLQLNGCIFLILWKNRIKRPQKHEWKPY